MQPDSALVERGRSRETAKRSDLGRSARFPGGSAKIQIGPDGMACRNDPGVVIRKDHGEAAVPQPLDDVGRRAVVVRNSDDEPYPLDAVLDQQPVPYVCSHGQHGCRDPASVGSPSRELARARRWARLALSTPTTIRGVPACMLVICVTSAYVAV